MDCSRHGLQPGSSVRGTLWGSNPGFLHCRQVLLSELPREVLGEDPCVCLEFLDAAHISWSMPPSSIFKASNFASLSAFLPPVVSTTFKDP